MSRSGNAEFRCCKHVQRAMWSQFSLNNKQGAQQKPAQAAHGVGGTNAAVQLAGNGVQDVVPRKRQRVKSTRQASVEEKVGSKAGLHPDHVDPEVQECTRNFSEVETRQIRQQLLKWYDANHRVLPWRRNSSSKLTGPEQGAPANLTQQEFIYWVWVSEVMSQQTQVARAAEYFRRWIARWPTVLALSAASQDEVNEAWAGLGYYRRARFLLEGARYVVQHLGGVFPVTSADLQKIPGVGKYTGNAVASIAGGQPVAVVDANVVRVVSRLRRLLGDPSSQAMGKLVAGLAAQLVDPLRPGDFNQAMMELGAQVCTVQQTPQCSSCPIRLPCHAFRDLEDFVDNQGGSAKQGMSRFVTAYPSKVQKLKRREEYVAVGVVQLLPAGGPEHEKLKAEGKYLMVKRSAGGLLPGMWEFPSEVVNANTTVAERQTVLAQYLETILGLQLRERTSSLGKAAKRRNRELALKPDGTQELLVRFAGGGQTDDACADSGYCSMERIQLGQAVHVFSHINMTLHIEAITLQGYVPTAAVSASAGTLPAMRWLTDAQVVQLGLSSCTRKVYDFSRA